MLSDVINVYSVTNAQIHRAMTRLPVGYTLNDNHIGIYVLFF
jgi:hypothetical protein